MAYIELYKEKIPTDVHGRYQVQIAMFWNVTLYCLADVHQPFWGVLYHYLCSAIADFAVTKIQVYHVPRAISMVLRICPPSRTQHTWHMSCPVTDVSHGNCTWCYISQYTDWTRQQAKWTAWRRKHQNLVAISNL